MPPPVSVSFRRHSIKTKFGQQITAGGKKATKKLAKRIPKNTKFYTSPEIRTVQTADILKAATNTKYNLRVKSILNGHKYFSGRRIKTTKKDSLLTLFKDIANKAGVTDTALVKVWLKGNFPKKIVPKPEVIADEIIKDRFKLPNRVNRMTSNHIVFENITHDVVISAIFQRLSEEMYTSRFKSLPTELESLTINISKEGRAIMRYRAYKKDVTQKLKEILKS